MQPAIVACCRYVHITHARSIGLVVASLAAAPRSISHSLFTDSLMSSYLTQRVSSPAISMPIASGRTPRCCHHQRVIGTRPRSVARLFESSLPTPSSWVEPDSKSRSRPRPWVIPDRGGPLTVLSTLAARREEVRWTRLTAVASSRRVARPRPLVLRAIVGRGRLSARVATGHLKDHVQRDARESRMQPHLSGGPPRGRSAPLPSPPRGHASSILVTSRSLSHPRPP